MNDLPVMLKVVGRLCVVVGGGAVAARRIAVLEECGARVRVIAPDAAKLKADGIEIVPRNFQSGDLRGAVLVVVATDDPSVNEAVAADAASDGVLVNRADDSAAGDITIPAHSHHGPITLAVGTGGISAAAAAAIRRGLDAALDPAWPRLLELIAPYRASIQERFGDAGERQSRLVRLADGEMLNLLKSGGEAAVRARADSLLARPAEAAR